MKTPIRTYASFVSALTLAFGFLLVPAVSHAQAISQTAKAGVFSVTLKVLPAESFKGPKAAMTRDAGAEPEFLNGSAHPNHHMVVFVQKNGKPVQDALVHILYRQVTPKTGGWMTLPVVRMHVTGQSIATTHYGNNLKLEPGTYEVRATVNGYGPADFRFSLAH